MERTIIKSNFIGFAQRVAPLQKVFDKGGDDAVLNTDVLQFFSGLGKELVGNMMEGASAISQHRRSEEVAAEDLLLHLETQWNLDPLLMSANCMKTCYQLTKRTDEMILSTSPEPVAKKRKTKGSRNLPKVRPASSKPKKVSSRKSKLKSKQDQSIKVIKGKSKVNLKNQVTCPKDPFKNSLPLSNQKPESKAKKQRSIKASVPNKLEFPGNKCKFAGNYDGVLKPSIGLPVCKSKSKEEEKKLISQNSINIPPVEGKDGWKEWDVPVWYTLDPKTNALKIVGLRMESVADVVPKSPVICRTKLKSKVHEQSPNCEYSEEILPFKEKTEPEVKVPSKNLFDPETCKHKRTGIRDCLEQSPETCINIPKSNVDEKMSECKHSTGLFPFKEKTEPEIKVLTKICSDGFTPKFRTNSGFKDYSKKSRASINIPKSHVGEKMSIIKHSTEVFKEKAEPEYKGHKNNDPDRVIQKFKIPVIKDLSQKSQALMNNPSSNVEKAMSVFKHFRLVSNEKTEPEFKLAKQASNAILCSNSQVLKFSEKKGKQAGSSVKCASDETLEETRHDSVGIPHPDSCAHKISLKRHKQESFDINEVKVETPEEGRRKLAMTLLRIAGKCKKDCF